MRFCLGRVGTTVGISDAFLPCKNHLRILRGTDANLECFLLVIGWGSQLYVPVSELVRKHELETFKNLLDFWQMPQDFMVILSPVRIQGRYGDFRIHWLIMVIPIYRFSPFQTFPWSPGHLMVPRLHLEKKTMVSSLELKQIHDLDTGQSY